MAAISTSEHDSRSTGKSAGAPGTFRIERGDGTATLRAEGDWTLDHLRDIRDRLPSADSLRPGTVRIDLSGLSRLDTAGAHLLCHFTENLNAAGVEAAMAGAERDAKALIDLVSGKTADEPGPPPAPHPFIQFVINCGEATVSFFREGRDLLNFLGLLVVAIAFGLVRPHRWRVKAVFAHIESTGINALPIVGLLTFLIGIVLAYQGSDQLARFGAEIFTVNLVGIGVLRELGILITSIIVAGRSGSAFTAQIGTMKVNEEVDALRTIGIDPIEVLVLPRVVALIIVLPLLTFYADVMALAGGFIMVWATLDISLLQFIRQLETALGLWTFWVGIIKAPLFAFIIAMVGCFRGLKVTGSAQSVGEETTRSVVLAIFLVILLDAMLSIFFSIIGI